MAKRNPDFPIAFILAGLGLLMLSKSPAQSSSGTPSPAPTPRPGTGPRPQMDNDDAVAREVSAMANIIQAAGMLRLIGGIPVDVRRRMQSIEDLPSLVDMSDPSYTRLDQKADVLMSRVLSTEEAAAVAMRMQRLDFDPHDFEIMVGEELDRRALMANIIGPDAV